MPDGAAPATDVMAFVRLSNCAGGVDGSRAQVATGIAFVHVHQAQVTCGTLQQPTSPQTAEALVRWDDATGQAIGITAVGMQPFDSRGATLTASASGTAFPAHAIALRLPPDATGCGDIAPISAGRVTVWPA
jgi:hypothetical protein